MSRLDEFLRLLCGRFDNTRQLEELRRSGSPALPLAEHVNTVCNDKIDGLPADFAGAFVLEESYYTTEGKTHASPHLLLFTEEGEAVKLTSYQLPKAADGGAATYETLPPLKWRIWRSPRNSRLPSIRCTTACGRGAASACSPRC